MPGRSKLFPFQKKRSGGKLGGTYYVRIKGIDVNLRTQEAGEALKRAKEARLAGKREFSADSDATQIAKAVGAAVAGTDPASTGTVVETAPPEARGNQTAGPSPPPGFAPALTAAPSLPPSEGQPDPGTPPRGQGVRPDAVLPPPADWAERLGQAAGEAGAAGEDTASTPEDEKLDADLLEDMLIMAADGAVELQIRLQAAALARGAVGPKVRAAVVDDTAKGRAVGRKIWLRCFRRLVPTDLGIPDWLAAPVLVAGLTLPVQLGEGAEIIPDKPKPGQGAPPVSSTAETVAREAPQAAA